MKDKSKLISVLAFLALMISGILAIVLFFIDLFAADQFNVRPFQLIAYSLTTIVVVWVGWQYAKDLNMFWKVFYLVLGLLALFGAIWPLIM